MILNIIFASQDDPKGGPQQQVFVEVHDENGKSINVGEWTSDGEFEQLTIDLFKLAMRPLNWEQEKYGVLAKVASPFRGLYMVAEHNGTFIGSVPGQIRFDATSIEDGKAKCEAHWAETLRPFFRREL